MPVCLSMYLYKQLQEHVQKEFEKSHTILSFDDIQQLKNDGGLTENTLAILKSAVVDHKIVGGKSYYLSPPLMPWMYHDNFKRCLIADFLADAWDKAYANQKKLVHEILDGLIRNATADYVRVFAGHGFGKWIDDDVEFLSQRQEVLIRAPQRSAASVLGIVLILEQLIKCGLYKEVGRFVRVGISQARYKVQRALWGYFLSRHGYYEELEQLKSYESKDFSVYLEEITHKIPFQSFDFEKGIKEIGLIPREQKNGLMDGTEQAFIAAKLQFICRDYLAAVGYYVRVFWA